MQKAKSYSEETLEVNVISSLHFIRFGNEYFLYGNDFKSLQISFALKCSLYCQMGPLLSTQV